MMARHTSRSPPLSIGRLYWVRGVQLSQGLSFAFSVIKYICYDQDLAKSKSGPLRPWLGLDGIIVALAVVLFLVLTIDVGDTPLNNHPEGCWFGAMPCCHGAGGLAGQYRFGGRSGASVVFLGIGKLVIALVFGNSFGKILNQFPIGILGVLLLFAGIELAMASKDMNTKQESFVMFVCVAVSLTGSSAALGFFVGIDLYLLLKLREVECYGGSGFGFGLFRSKKAKSSVDEETRLIS
ncbi:Molybdate transporter 1/2 [Sesbania bispinosa]|nr:Molybdate transporter 1/2 [Sesbania bispinosa]